MGKMDGDSATELKSAGINYEFVNFFFNLKKLVSYFFFILIGKIESIKLSKNLKAFHVIFTDNLKYIFKNHILKMDEN